MTTSPDREPWRSARAGSLERHAASPEPRGLGITLRAPETAAFGDRIPIAGCVAWTGSDLATPMPWAHRLGFVATVGERAFVGHWPSTGKHAPSTPAFGGRALTERELRRTAVEHFSHDLDALFRARLCGLVHVYAFYGRFVSNVVSIDVVAEDVP